MSNITKDVLFNLYSELVNNDFENNSTKRFSGKEKIEKSKKVSKKSLKRFAALLASGLMTISLKASAIMIKNGEDSTSHPYKIVEQMEDRELSDFEKTQIEVYRKQLMEQFDSSNVKLDSIYITSVYIEGTKVRVELKDNSFVEGEATNLEFGRIKLDNFYIIMDEEDSYNNSSKNVQIKQMNSLSKIKVNGKFKYFSNISTKNYITKKIKYFDLSATEHVWIGRGAVTEDEIKEICSSKRLKSLYLTDRVLCCYF